MFGSVKRLVRNKKGAFAIQFALMAVPLTVCTGLAVDGGRAFLARFELASALDAAALAVGSTLQTQGTDLNAVAAKFVEKNFRTEHSEPIVLSLVSVDDTVVLRGSVKINTLFMPIVGQPTVTINAESEVRRGGSNIEVAMALDITGSMSESRMEGLTTAAKILIDEVVNPIQKPFFSKAAIVPWSESINLVKPGTAAKDTYTTTAALDQLRGTIIGARSISAASWRPSGHSNLKIALAGWRTTNGARTIDSKSNLGVDWRWGSSVKISNIDRYNVGTTKAPVWRVRVTTSSTHGYANGQFVRITGANGGYTDLNDKIYMVSYVTSSPENNTGANFQLKKVDGSWVVGTSGTNGPTVSSKGDAQRCYDKECNVGVTAANVTNIAKNDYVNITGVSGFNAINNSDTTTWQVAEVIASANTFTIDNWDGPAQGAMSAGGGTVSECLVSDCRYIVKTGTTSTPANHGYQNNDTIAIWGISQSGSGKSAINAINTSWRAVDPSGDLFYLPGKGKDYLDWTANGWTSECALDTCNMRITVGASDPVSTLSAGDRIEVTGMKNLTWMNNPVNANTGLSFLKHYTWKIRAIDGNVLTLEDTSPALGGNTGNDATDGVVNCTVYGCARLDILPAGKTDNHDEHRVYKASPCLVERYGKDAATDASPATSPLTIYYTSNGTCNQTNYVTPLTPDKDRLKAGIDALTTGGSTSGQLGIAWAWYLLSPNFGHVWDKESDENATFKQVNVPLSYEAPETAKIAILMTDGEFNYATCGAVNTGTVCTPSRTPFQQAESICAAMKDKDIIIYTVGLELNKAQYSDDFLLKCATSPQHAFLADNNAELEQAFKDIAVSINRLRISR